ncbi:hypothetical protein BCR44DRAFT_1103913 [Catenaria anguillulae PL171]|uniref:Uncharacterized protein n=1 Tax=Catenaria anguillulae PL171 TaxID=765915 RepID=A0A1Y2I2D6_9FUNG|nr:hypothetical protein BCR44DRAFT_1103913 [Catenaria anguillulae PL171]
MHTTRPSSACVSAFCKSAARRTRRCSSFRTPCTALMQSRRRLTARVSSFPGWMVPWTLPSASCKSTSSTATTTSFPCLSFRPPPAQRASTSSVRHAWCCTTSSKPDSRGPGACTRVSDRPKRPVFVYRFVIFETIDDAVFKQQVRKTSLARQTLDKERLHKIFSRAEVKNQIVPGTCCSAWSKSFGIRRLPRTFWKRIPYWRPWCAKRRMSSRLSA